MPHPDESNLLDVLSVLERCRKMLDIKYLEQWAGRLGFSAEQGYFLGEERP